MCEAASILRATLKEPRLQRRELETVALQEQRGLCYQIIFVLSLYGLIELLRATTHASALLLAFSSALETLALVLKARAFIGTARNALAQLVFGVAKASLAELTSASILLPEQSSQQTLRQVIFAL